MITQGTQVPRYVSLLFQSLSVLMSQIKSEAKQKEKI